MIAMNILNKIFGKKEKVAKPLTLDLDQVEETLVSKIGDEKIYDEGEYIVREVSEILERIKKIMRDMERYRFPRDIEKKIYKPVKTSKPLYIKGILEGVRNIEVPESLNYENSRRFHKSLLNALKIIHKVQLSHGRYVAVVFRELVLKLGTELNRLIDLTKELDEILKQRDEGITQLHELSHLQEEIKNRIKEKMKAKEKKTELKQKIKELAIEKNNLQEELKGIKDSEASKDYVDLKQKLEDIKKEKNNIRLTILNQLGPLKRVLRKFQRLLEDGEYKTDLPQEMIEGYISRPVETFLSDSSHAIGDLLEMLVESIKEGKIKLKHREGEKVIRKIHEILKSDFKNLRDNYEKIQLQEDKIKDKISEIKVLDKVEDIKDRLKINEDDTVKLENQLKRISDEVARSKKTIPKLKRDLENGLSETLNKTIKIKV